MYKQKHHLGSHYALKLLKNIESVGKPLFGGKKKLRIKMKIVKKNWRNCLLWGKMFFGVIQNLITI